MADDDMMSRFESPDDAPRTRVGEHLERWAYNQMPKSGWRDLQLFNYDGTNLYQWFGKKGRDSDAKDWTPFEDSASEVFRIVAR